MPCPLFDLYEFAPEPDITAFEVALMLRDLQVTGRSFPARFLVVPTGEPPLAADWPEETGRHWRLVEPELSSLGMGSIISRMENA